LQAAFAFHALIHARIEGLALVGVRLADPFAAARNAMLFAFYSANAKWFQPY